MTGPSSSPTGDLVAAPVRGTLAFVALRILGLLVGTATSLALVRLLTIEEFGTYAAGTGALLLVSALGFLGTDQLLFSSRLSLEEFERLLPVVAGAVLVATACLTFLWPVPGPHGRLLVLCLGTARALELLRGSWLIRPQLSRRHLRRASREFGAQLVLAAGTVLVVVRLSDTAIGAASGTLAASALVTGVLLLRSATRPAQGRPRALVAPIRDGLAFSVSSILYSLTHTVGLAMIALLAVVAEVAVFRTAMLVYTAALVIPIAVNNDVLRPHLMTQLAHRQPTAPAIVNRTLGINLALAGLCAIGVLVFAATLAEPVFGQEYEHVRMVLLPLATALPFAFVSSYLANMLVAMKQVRVVVLAQLGLLALAIMSSAILIVVGDAMGAACAMLVVDVSSVALYAGLWHRFVLRGGS